MKQATKRLASSIVALAFLVGAIIVFFNLISPAFTDISGMRGEEISLQNAIQNQAAIVGEVKKAVEAYRGEEAVQSVASEVLPLSPDIAGALAEISGIASKDNMAPQSISLTAAASQNAKPVGALAAASSTPLILPIGVLNFQIKLAGSYGDFKNFLGDLETNIRIMDVKNISFERQGKPNADSFLYAIVVSAYYQNP